MQPPKRENKKTRKRERRFRVFVFSFVCVLHLRASSMASLIVFSVSLLALRVSCFRVFVFSAFSRFLRFPVFCVFAFSEFSCFLRFRVFALSGLRVFAFLHISYRWHSAPKVN